MKSIVMAQSQNLVFRYGAQIGQFAEVLCSLFSPSHPLPTLNIPAKFGRPEFQVRSICFKFTSTNMFFEIPSI